MPENFETIFFENSFEFPNPNLRSYFGRVVAGQPDVYDTPFARGESTQTLLREWKEVLESVSTRWPTLWDFENDLASKVGPMSVMKPLSQRMDDIESYYEGILLPSEPISEAATTAVCAEWSKVAGLRARKPVTTVRLMKKSTNSGSPYFKKRRLVTERNLPAWFETNKGGCLYQFLDIGPHRTSMWGAPAILGWRGQEGGPDPDDVKQRVVWMFPYAVNIAELTVYQVMIEAAQKFNIVPAWVSMEQVDRVITRLFDSKSPNDLVVCTDFSKFDQHFGPVLQDAARTIIERILTKDQVTERWLAEVYPIKYMIPLTYNWNTVKFGNHGMGSGSGGTNCDETLAHRALQHEAAMKHKSTLNPNSQCLGDDGILSYPGITVDDVVTAYKSHGLEMNLDKQYASTQDCVYLRRWHHRDYRVSGVCAGVYSTCRALGRLRYLERWQNPEYWDAKAVALRQLSILENVKYHPLREEFVRFCMKRDKYRLGLDIPHFLDDIETVAKEKIDNMPDFLGYTKTLQSGSDELGGISQWWIVNYLKSMR